MSESALNQPGVPGPTPIQMSAALDALLDWSMGGALEPLLLPVSGSTETETEPESEPVTLELRLTDQLRVLPGRRLVCGGFLATAPIVVKWFFGDAAMRYAERERQGVAALHGAGMPTPALLANLRVTASSSGDAEMANTQDVWAASALIFERLPEVAPVDDALLSLRPGLWPLLWQLLAGLHRAGVIHTDLHFGNLLYTPPDLARPVEVAAHREQLWLIDGDGVRQTANPQVPLAVCVQAFAELAAQAQHSLTVEGLRDHWASYCEARGWPLDQPGLGLLARRYQIARRARIVHFQAKTRRNCTDFAKRRTILGTALVDRSWLNAVADPDAAEIAPGVTPEANSLRELLAWLDALPTLMAEQIGERLKAGNTATVVRLSWRGLPLVVKRYNNKSVGHRLRRLARPDRGLNSWVFAHTLRFVGIPTARAVALLRTRLGGPTYLVMEASAGVELNAAHLEADESLCQRLVAMLDDLGAEGLVHNDTKASNFLWDKNGDALTLIDLDAMQMPASQKAQLSGQKRDRRRLLRNFAATPELQRRFRSALGL